MQSCILILILFINRFKSLSQILTLSLSLKITADLNPFVGDKYQTCQSFSNHNVQYYF